MIKRFFVLEIVVGVSFLLMACGTTSQDRDAPRRPAPSQETPIEISDTQPGLGQAETLLKALNKAKMDAVQKMVTALIGKESEEKNHTKLQQSLYNTNNPNQFVNNDTLVINRRDSVGALAEPSFVVEISIKVNRPAISQSLRALGIPVNDGSLDAISAKPAAVVSDPDGATDAQKAFIRKYVDRLSYLVYFGEKTNEKDAFLLKAAITQANSYLTTNGYTAIDSAQVEKLKKDKEKIYEEQTGKQISLIQWIAQSLNADVYLEIDASTTSESRSGNYYAQAIVTVKMYETSTGQLLGSQPFNSPKTMSKVDETDALSNALQSSVYTVMPTVIEQSKNLLAKQFANGIKYEVTMQKVTDARVLSNFRTKLKKQANIADVSTRNQNADEVIYDVYYYGKADDLMDAILNLSGTVAGLENLDLVMSRGKTMVFSGM